LWIKSHSIAHFQKIPTLEKQFRTNNLIPVPINFSSGLAANKKNEILLKQFEAEYSELLEKFYKEMNVMFDLEKIRWKG
jgi:hypothetical protein